MRTVECSACGAPAKVERGSHEFAECGLRLVLLEGIDLIRCGDCKNVDPIIPRVNQLMRVVAFALICKPCGLAGQEVRFLRKYLGMTGEEFAGLLHVDKTTLSKWENDDDPVGVQSDRLIRLLTLSLGEGLKERLLEVDIRTSFPQIKDSRRRLPIHINPAKMSYQYV